MKIESSILDLCIQFVGMYYVPQPPLTKKISQVKFIPAQLQTFFSLLGPSSFQTASKRRFGLNV